jgi:hypothetical protein
MELGELTREVLALFGVSDVADLGVALMECAVSENEEKMDAGETGRHTHCGIPKKRLYSVYGIAGIRNKIYRNTGLATS